MEMAVTPDAMTPVAESAAAETPGRGAANLTVGVARGVAASLGIPPPADSHEALMRMINQYFKVLSTVAKNMGVSPERRALAERHQKELAKKRREAEELKRELDATLREIGDFLADDEDKRRLEERLSECSV